MRLKTIIVAFVLFIFPLQLFAQNSEQRLEVQGLALSPFLIETELEAGDVQLHTITLTNTTNLPLPIEISINDFVPNGETGETVFLNSGEESDPRFSLSSWIRIVNQPDFTIEPGAQTEVQFAIEPPVDAEPGSHYGGLLFSYRPTVLADTSVTVTQKAGVLVIAKLGNANYRATVTSFRAEPSLDYSNVNFFPSIFNQGNAHIKPKGDVVIENMFGRQVGSVPVNRDANIILPESQRNFQSTWESGWRLGRYTATAILFYGNPKLEIRTTTVFWIVPWQRLLVVISVLVLLGLIGYTSVKRYNRWLVSRNNKL